MPVELKNVSYKYAPGTPYEANALKGVSLTFEDGDFTAVMGRTGCGKSSLIQLAAGLIRPTEGQILLDGEDICGPSFDRMELRRKVGIVFQFPEYQLFETTVERDISFGLKRFGLSEEEKKERVSRALAAVGFDYTKVAELSPLGFSGGEKRRLAIAGVLAAEPRVLMLDEPVAGLDPFAREEFLSMLDRMNAAGTTIIMVTHNADAAAEHAGKTVILSEGRVVKSGSSADVFADAGELLQYGVGSSEVKRAADRLRSHGLKLPAGTIRYGQLLTALTETLGSTCGNHRNDADSRNGADSHNGVVRNTPCARNRVPMKGGRL